MSTERIRSLSRWVLAASALAVLVLVGWGAAAYVQLIRLQVEVADAEFRVEAAARSRAELAANFVHASEAFGWLASSRLEALRSATERARASTLAADSAGADDPYQEFLLAQAELATLLDRIWSEALAMEREGARAMLDDLHASLVRSGELVTARLEQLDRRLEAYRAGAERFPGSLIAAVVARDGLSMLRGRADASPAARRATAGKLAG